MSKKPSYEELESKIIKLEENAASLDALVARAFEDQQFLKILIDTIPSPIFYKDRDGVYRHCNEAFSKIILGLDREQIVSKSLFDLPDKIPVELARIYSAKDQYLFDNPGTQTYQGEVKCSDNKIRMFQFYKSTILSESGDVVGLVGVMLDITKLEEKSSRLSIKNSQLESLSYIDALTGIFNRRKFEKIFSQQLEIPRKQNRILNIAILDIDFFKSYNDFYGHPKGDEALKLVADIIKHAMRRPDDYAFRVGGEEFCLLFWSRDESGAKTMADKIKTEVESLAIAHEGSEKKGVLTLSMGLLTIQGQNIDKELLYEEADKLLYKAKRSGRNKIKHKLISE